MIKQLPRKPQGFTLVELLVVILIIAILIALLVPAVQKVREAGARTACVNNLKQIALAIHHYHEAFNKLPPGNVITGSYVYWSTWTIELLPYLEMQGLYDSYDFKVNNQHANNTKFTQTIMPVYTCPVDFNSYRRDVIPESGGASRWFMMSSYRAVSGKTDNGGSVWYDNEQNSASNAHYRGPIHATGVNNLRPERFKNITDGTSNTIMIGEYSTLTYPRRGVFWAYSYPYNQGSAAAQSATLLGDYEACGKALSGVGDNRCKRGWGSFHPGIINFAFCDATVRSVNININMVNVFQPLATIQGEEKISSNDY